MLIFWEVLKFLIKPSYINTDIISASACGYLLLIEICTFLMQFFVYKNPQSFKGLDLSSPANTYIDLVYFSSVTLTSIGFGDITPNAHHTKLIASLFGIAGQFYSVVLVGILRRIFLEALAVLLLLSIRCVTHFYALSAIQQCASASLVINHLFLKKYSIA